MSRLIDADALKEKGFSDPDTTMSGEAMVYVQDIDAAPTINPERPKGEWIQADEGEWICTNCKNEVTICDCGKDRTYRKPFCPNCGADMRGENNER